MRARSRPPTTGHDEGPDTASKPDCRDERRDRPGQITAGAGGARPRHGQPAAAGGNPDASTSQTSPPAGGPQRSGGLPPAAHSSGPAPTRPAALGSDRTPATATEEPTGAGNTPDGDPARSDADRAAADWTPPETTTTASSSASSTAGRRHVRCRSITASPPPRSPRPTPPPHDDSHHTITSPNAGQSPPTTSTPATSTPPPVGVQGAGLLRLQGRLHRWHARPRCAVTAPARIFGGRPGGDQTDGLRMSSRYVRVCHETGSSPPRLPHHRLRSGDAVRARPRRGAGDRGGDRRVAQGKQDDVLRCVVHCQRQAGGRGRAGRGTGPGGIGGLLGARRHRTEAASSGCGRADRRALEA
jgi:hypothetical protein